MNAANIGDDFDDDNVEALERAAVGLTDRNSAGLDHVLTAKRAVRLCIHVITGIRLDSNALRGRALDDHLQQLIEIEPT